jgi:hypothetical protein
MLIDGLTDTEVEAIIVALKYWRFHGRDSETRRKDPAMSREAVDRLLMKLEASTLSSLPPDDDFLSHLFLR